MKRALIVEDNPMWAAIFSRYCQQEGFEVIVTVSPQEAMDVLDETETVDVVVLDMLLATETGMALLNEMRSFDDLAAVPVIVCTSVDGMSLEQLLPFGVRAVLDKATLEPDVMRVALRGVVNG